MSTHDEDRMRKLLKESLPPIHEAEPTDDLWPSMQRRLEQRPAPPPWFDWVLAGGLMIFAFAFPATIPVFLYYL
jgi:hypothetical protein